MLLRYIVLDNGLAALLISDYSGPVASEHDDLDREEEGEDYDDEEEEEEEEDEDEEEENEHEDEADVDECREDKKGAKKKRGTADKQVPHWCFTGKPLLDFSRLYKHSASIEFSFKGRYVYFCNFHFFTYIQIKVKINNKK